MYEQRQKKIKDMQQKKWYNYAMLAAAMFVFSQSSAIIKTNMQFALPAIIVSFLMHTRSVGPIVERILKIKTSFIANIAMLVSLSAISIFCYYHPLIFFYTILLNIAAIAVYVLTAIILSIFKTGDLKK